MASHTSSAAPCWVRPSRLLPLLLLMATAAAAWRFDPWSQQWVAEETNEVAADARQGHVYQDYEQEDRGVRAQPRKDGKTAECKKNKAGRCLTKAERELLLPNGFSLGFEPKVSFNLYDSDDLGKLKVKMKTDITYDPPKDLVDDPFGRSMGANARVMFDKRLLYNTFKSMVAKFGADGDACLQRAVCEVAEAPLRRDGMIGEILNLVLSPSHRLDEAHRAEVADLLVAERRGRELGQCHLAYPRCPLSLFNAIDSASDYTGSILDALADHGQVVES